MFMDSFLHFGTLEFWKVYASRKVSKGFLFHAHRSRQSGRHISVHLWFLYKVSGPSCLSLAVGQQTEKAKLVLCYVIRVKSVFDTYILDLQMCIQLVRSLASPYLEINKEKVKLNFPGQNSVIYCFSEQFFKLQRFWNSL